MTYGPGLADRVRSLADVAGSVTAVLDTVGSDDSVAATAELLQGSSRAVTTVPGKRSSEAGLAAVRQLEGRIEEAATLAAEGQLTFTIAHRMPLIEAAAAVEISRTATAAARSCCCRERLRSGSAPAVQFQRWRRTAPSGSRRRGSRWRLKAAFSAVRRRPAG